MTEAARAVDAAGYRRELRRLQAELVKLQYWIRDRGLRVAVLFEGRDAAGKGGVIRRITRYTSPRVVRVAALPKPTPRERGQWYFQRYAAHLPDPGTMVLFDRSWYNRAGVETVMGFCSRAELDEFFVSCPQFERMLVRSGLLLVKYWFGIGSEEQERRFRARRRDARKVWKLSEMDLAARSRWVEYSRARDEMFRHCHTAEAPWRWIDGNDKRLARLNCIRHLLAQVPYEDLLGKPGDLPPAPPPGEYADGPRPPEIPRAYCWRAPDAGQA